MCWREVNSKDKLITEEMSRVLDTGVICYSDIQSMTARSYFRFIYCL